MALHILGIRHHGVGSAKQVLKRLEEIRPDIILVEGPPEISEALKEIGNKELVPPVALMVYNTKELSQFSFYPFSVFSPEWVAAKYANTNGIPLRAIDLPAALNFASHFEVPTEDSDVEIQFIRDPLSYLAEVEGLANGEEWWEHHFENGVHTGGAEHFEAVHHTMFGLREEGIASSLDLENKAREAYMRIIIQSVQNEMYKEIAIVCGAWHGPELIAPEKKFKEDQAIIKNLPKPKAEVACAWIPWTNSRLSMYSGYGAGLHSPGWYEHLWFTEKNIEVEWLTKIAVAFREADVDISTAHVLETYRLARALASIRNRSQIALDDLNEAVLTVMCMGDSILFELVKDSIIVAEKMGSIPDSLDKLPLHKDFESCAKSLRLTFSPFDKNHDLDLRKPLDLKKSIFFNLLELLDIPWAKRTSKRTKGTFKESWNLKWEPQMQIAIIDKAFYGNTVLSAAQAVVRAKSEKLYLISDLVNLLQQCIPAELFDSIDLLLKRINDESAISSDTRDLMQAIPSLVDIVKYGNVRKTDITHIHKISVRLISKTCITLPNACYGLDEDNSNILFELISALNTAILIMDDPEVIQDWNNTLETIISKQGIHYIIIGCTVRLLMDNGRLLEERANTLIMFYLSNKNNPAEVASWVEGFLRGSALILIYDNRIWNLLYTWVADIGEDDFLNLLPVLRRAFSKFQFGERRRIGEKASQGLVKETLTTEEKTGILFDNTRAESILPFIQKLLG